MLPEGAGPARHLLRECQRDLVAGFFRYDISRKVRLVAVLALMCTWTRFNRDLLPSPLVYYRKEGIKLFGSGQWRSTRCPIHKVKKPSLSIHVPSGGFNCHGCGAKGRDVLAFHRKRYELTFEEAAKALGAWDVTADVSPRVHSRLPQRLGDPVKIAARRHAERELGKDFRPEALHVYRDKNGNPLFWVIRARHSRTGEKWIRPMHLAGHQYVLGLPKFKDGKPLYGLELLTKKSKEPVVICEGEKCADALRKLRLLAISSHGGANSAASTDWKPVAGREILIWPDHDEAGHR